MRTCSEQLKVFRREKSCYCHGCIVENLDSCENKKWVGNWKEIVLSREPSGVRPEQLKMQAPLNIQFKLLTWQPKTVLWLWQLKMTAIMITTSLKLVGTSSGIISLQENLEDPYSGSIYSKGQAVLLGNFFLRENIIDHMYKLDDNTAGVFPGTVRCICGPLVSKQKRGRPIYQVPMDEHEQILASL